MLQTCRVEKIRDQISIVEWAIGAYRPRALVRAVPMYYATSTVHPAVTILYLRHCLAWNILLVMPKFRPLVLTILILQPLIKRHLPAPTRVVIPMMVLPQLVNLLDILLLQRKLRCLEVLLDVVLVHALRDHARAAEEAPLQDNLRWCAVALLGDLVDYLALEERGWVVVLVFLIFLVFALLVVGWVCAAEWGVGRDVDAVSLVEVDPFVLLEVWVQLHLVHLRWGGGVVQQILELFWREVRDTNVSRLAFLFKQDHA